MVNRQLVIKNPGYIQHWINNYLTNEDKKLIIVKLLSKIFKIKKNYANPIDTYEKNQKKQGFYCYNQLCKIINR